MQLINYLQTKVPVIAIFGLVFGLTSCGSYQYVGQDSDGIYESSEKTVEPKVETVDNSSNSYYQTYFKEKSKALDMAVEEGEIFTDIDSYEGDYNDEEVEENTVITNYASWGQESDNITINVYSNNSGYYNYWNRPYYGYGWNRWARPYNGWNVGFGYGYNSYGWNSPFWCSPYNSYGYGNYYGNSYYNNYNNYGYYGRNNYGRRGITYNSGRRGSLSRQSALGKRVSRTRSTRTRTTTTPRTRVRSTTTPRTRVKSNTGTRVRTSTPRTRVRTNTSSGTVRPSSSGTRTRVRSSSSSSSTPRRSASRSTSRTSSSRKRN